MQDRVLLLAAGQSSRMRGRDKLMEPVDGHALLRRQVVLAQSLGWPVHVALPPSPHPRYDAVQDLPVSLHAIEESSEGMGGTLRGAVGALKTRTRDLLLILADLPDLTAQDLLRMTAARDAHPEAAIWRGATVEGAPGHPILFSHATLDGFDGLAGDDGGRALMASYGPEVHLVPLPGRRARRDLDTPEDWAAWRAEQQQQ